MEKRMDKNCRGLVTILIAPKFMYQKQLKRAFERHGKRESGI